MIEFIDCPRCKKRIREDAKRCHRCGATLANPDEEHVEGEAHFASGGYDAESDDFDYDEYVEQEFKHKPRLNRLWLGTLWLLIAVLVLPLLWQAYLALR